MAARRKKGLQDSIDDVLGDLLGDDDFSSPKPQKISLHKSVPVIRPRSNMLSNPSKKSPLDENYFSQLAKEAEEESDISEADAQALLESMKDLDDMDAEIFGTKKPKSAPAKNVGMGQGTDIELRKGDKAMEPRRGRSAPESEKKASPAPVAQPRSYKKFSFDDEDDPLAGLMSDEDNGIAKKTKTSGHFAPEIEKKPSSAPAAPSHSEKRLSFDDLDDPLAGLLSDEDNGNAKMTKTTGYVPTHESVPLKNAATPLSSPVRPSPGSRRKDVLTFDDDTDDIMDALGFGDSPQTPQKKESSTARPARSKLDELMGRGTAAKLLERPPTGERKEFKLDPKYQKKPEKEDILADEDIAFGSYQPTILTSPEGRMSRRSSVRFSAESNENVKATIKSQPTTPKAQSPSRGDRSGADWLGLKDDEILDAAPSLPIREPSRSSAVTPTSTSRPQSGTENGPAAKPRESKPEASSKHQEKEKDEWLTSALARKKSQIQEKEEEKPQAHNVTAEITGNSGQAMSLTTSQKSIQPKTTKDRASPVSEVSGFPLPWESQQNVGVSTVVFSSKQEDVHQKDPSVPSEPLTAKKEEPTTKRFTERRVREVDQEPMESKSHILDLEAQVRKLQLENEQQNIMLETLQQRHREDLDLIENAHRNRLKLLEDSARQREERLFQENKQLSAQYLSQCQAAEHEKTDLLAKYQKRLTEFQQEKELEVERIRELQRASVKEMCIDYEEQLHRIKRLKDQEIDAVTSASSQTRSLNGVIEQMESYFHKLSELSEKVENTQVTKSEIGVRQREGQLKVLQERLSRQQKDMEEERNNLRMIITNMETRLSEQSRLLEQERWKASAEQAKVESLQRSLEEQRRVLTQQLSLEREELDRAKSALLEEQQSVMMRCAEERRKLAAEWSEFYTQHKLSKERAEKDVNRALMLETQREGTIISLAKEQAELKVQATELRNREEQLTLAKEAVEKERQELRLEKERLNALALRVQHRAEEIEHMSKLASQRYEDGEKALEEAKKVESEHHVRLKTIQQKLSWLRQEEERIHQQRLNLTSQRRQLDKLHQGLPTSSALFPAVLQEPHLISQLPGLQSVNATSVPGKREDNRTLQTSEFQAKLALLKLAALQDKNFLEDEQMFLETLKKSSNSWSQVA
ncbi:fas-binding factor 1 isoform X2 [Pelobates fuscus]|uniref:fas-binding factor 1 isoform X2 n=1 Tax=Pelobates fuscus TaxID=191477 RepID=UPI002FE45829